MPGTDLTSPSAASARSEAITPARLEELLAAATPGPWSGVPSIPQEGYECYWLCASKPYPPPTRGMAIYEIAAINGPQSGEQEANAALIALSPALAARVIELEEDSAAKGRRIAALEIAGKHLAVKLAEVYRAANANPADCQAVRDWISIMPARTALEPRHD